ncbi:hypothetical protein BURPSS13_T0552 [Burkholderia pseudomallei S13]|nr:hypothetical protein BURPSS13_T0552 [Burkholderia pseudomallei S13]
MFAHRRAGNICRTSTDAAVTRTASKSNRTRRNKRKIMKAPIIAIAFGIALAACAPLRQDSRSGEAGPPIAAPNRGGGNTPPSGARRAANEVVDYAGRPCVNQTLYVKTHPCIFPRLQR